VIALVALALLPLASAGALYINGVRADEPPAVTLEGVTVRIDAGGNIFIDAPRYNVQVVSAAPAVAARPTTAATATAAPLTWYLVSEDLASVGGAVDVYLNGAYVRRLQSGQSQVLVDLSSFVRPGLNTVKFAPVSPASQGDLGAYIGGANGSGSTLRIDAPSVTWRAGMSPTSQEYTFVVP
jgi:hypothetical protein